MKKVVLAIISVFLFLWIAGCNGIEEKQTQKLFENNFIIVSNSEGLYGLMNLEFELIVDFQYDKIYDFRNDLAIVIKDNQYGVINKEGDVIISLEYDEIVSHDYNFHFRVSKEFNYSYFDETGQVMTIREYCESIGLGEDAYIVFFKLSADAYGFTDIDGNVVIEPIYGDIYHDFFTEYNFVRLGGKWGIINHEGDFVISPTFRKISSTNMEGLTNVYLDGLWGVMEDNGTYRIPLEYEMEFLFTEASLATAKKNGLYGIINSDGEIVVEVDNESNNTTNKSLYQNHIISLAGEKNYLYDSTGKIVYETDMTINQFNQQYILMTDTLTNTRYVKNYKDKTILEIQNDNLYYFSNLDTKFIFKRQLVSEQICTIVYDEDGDIINPEGVYFNDVTGYNYSSKQMIGFTRCGSTKAGFINETGNWIIEPSFNFKYYYIYDDGYILINVDGLWGIINMEGEVILDFEYSSIGW